MMESILKGVYSNHCDFEIMGEAEIVKTFTNVNEEYDAIRNDVGIMDFSNYGIIKVTGNDVIDFLQNLTTGDFEYLAPEKARTTLMLNEDGEIISLVHVFNLETYYYVLTDPQHTAATVEWMESHIEGDVKVELRTGEDAVIAIEGPKAWEIAKEYLPFEISAFAFMNVSEVDILDKKVVMSRFGFTGEYGYIFIAPKDIAVELWNDVMEQGSSKNIRPCGNSALAVCMLEVRQPDINVEVLEGVSLFESKLQWLIDFTKEDYIGFEAIQNMIENATEKGIIGFVCDMDKSVENNSMVSIEGEEIGKVLCCYESKKMEKKLGLMLVKDEFVAVGLELEAKDAHGNLVDIKTISNPYIIPESWIVKML